MAGEDLCAKHIKQGDTDIYLQYTVWVTKIQHKVNAWPIGKG
ncbi:hypothetical protein VCR20J5_280046 [Vibrio crassostreae]|nr:hypothetical protein VCR20J5_280046 [Vibrio crassostreae]CDT52920.1 hypothetical protein VCR15J5_670049 [Vibrio crassostreae]